MNPQAGDVWRKGDEERYVRHVDSNGVYYVNEDSGGVEHPRIWSDWSAGAVLVHRAGPETPGETEIPAWARMIEEQRIQLRDYFAAAALTGMLASESAGDGLVPYNSTNAATFESAAAGRAYEFADAMIAARSPQGATQE